MSYMMCGRVTFPQNDRREKMGLHLLSSVKIESSWKMLTDTAEITLPRKIVRFDRKELRDLLQAGDEVKVELGYGNELYPEFEGYITSVSRGIPVVIRCEDEMYKLKRKTVSYSAKNVKLKKLLQDIAQGYEVKTNFDVELGAVRYSGKTVAQVLEDIRKKTNLHCYFVGKTLHCGNVYTENAQTEKVWIELEKNAVSQDLNETNGEAQVKAICIGPNGKKLEASAGTEGGEVYNLTYNEREQKVTVAELKKFAVDFYEGLKKQKYKGGVELFGIPVVHPGMTVALSSIITPEMNGSYYVEKVTKEFSDNATYRQKLELGGRAE